MKCPVCGKIIKKENLKKHLEEDYRKAEECIEKNRITMSLVYITAKEYGISLTSYSGVMG